jgi:predicted dehydrogenase
MTGISTLGPGYVHVPRHGRAAKALKIGVIGAGWIVRECHLPAYRKAGFSVRAIASRTTAAAERAAAGAGIAVVHRDWHELLADPAIDVLDLAVPPDVQPQIIKAAVRHGDHIRGILAQKPLAMDTAAAAEAVRLCDEAGIALSVNQNMRFDQSVRALKSLLEAGRLGTVYSAQIVMHARVEWMPYAAHYQRRALLIMSIHHLDTFRYLFGEPARVLASGRPHRRIRRLRARVRQRPARRSRRQLPDRGRPGHRMAGRGQRRRGQGNHRLDVSPGRRAQHHRLHDGRGSGPVAAAPVVPALVS